jgi:hypothetical protein
VNFARVLKEVLWCLVTEGGISYRRIRLSYGLDDDAAEELRHELISVKRLAADGVPRPGFDHVEFFVF